MNRYFKIFDLRMMQVSREFSLGEDNIFDNKRLSFGIDSGASKLFAGTTDGYLK